MRCDVADDAQVEAMVEQTVATFGRLDAAYNNAGIQNVLAETADSRARITTGSWASISAASGAA